MVTGSDPITPDDLRRALGWTVTSFFRARRAGKVPAPTAYTPGGHARWTVAVATETVRAFGRAVPEAWLAETSEAAA